MNIYSSSNNLIEVNCHNMGGLKPAQLSPANYAINIHQKYINKTLLIKLYSSDNYHVYTQNYIDDNNLIKLHLLVHT